MSNNEKENSEFMITTLDNPYNPFTQFDEWKAFDEGEKYFTLSYLGRIVDYSNCVTEEDRRNARESAIEEIIRVNPLKIYCKVYKDETVRPIQIETI